MILGDPEIKTGGKNRIGMKLEGLKLKEDLEYQFGDFGRDLQFFWHEQNAQRVFSENLAKTLSNFADKIIDSITTVTGTSVAAKANEDRITPDKIPQFNNLEKIIKNYCKTGDWRTFEWK